VSNAVVLIKTGDGVTCVTAENVREVTNINKNSVLYRERATRKKKKMQLQEVIAEYDARPNTPVIIVGMLSVQRSVSVRSDVRVLTHGFYAPSPGMNTGAVEQLLSRALGRTKALREKHGYDGVCVLTTKEDMDVVQQLSALTLELLRTSGTGKVEDLMKWTDEELAHRYKAIVNVGREHGPERMNVTETIQRIPVARRPAPGEEPLADPAPYVYPRSESDSDDSQEDDDDSDMEDSDMEDDESDMVSFIAESGSLERDESEFEETEEDESDTEAAAQYARDVFRSKDATREEWNAELARLRNLQHLLQDCNNSEIVLVAVALQLANGDAVDSASIKRAGQRVGVCMSTSRLRDVIYRMAGLCMLIGKDWYINKQLVEQKKWVRKDAMGNLTLLPEGRKNTQDLCDRLGIPFRA